VVRANYTQLIVHGLSLSLKHFFLIFDPPDQKFCFANQKEMVVDTRFELVTPAMSKRSLGFCQSLRTLAQD
jgi:hypothetical protein